ncbi:MAG: indole-3-glycerol-phosphate synthase [Deltaproteobacteria bacterium]|jgi:indole-3-glycerol phosphate synthase|nr:indole-3-glycerol-phosphate synthase [Deltaproteobacteria bacterium]
MFEENKKSLNVFREAKKSEIARLEALSQNGGGLEAALRLKPKNRPGFLAALREGRKKRGLGVIAEYKRASPSLGDINLTLTPEEAALAYRAADACSALTEEKFFKGSLSFVPPLADRGKPVLRKDFIFHRLQVVQTAETPASALLLIVGLTPDPLVLEDLRLEAESFGLEAVVEVFSAEELDLARRSGAKLIQFNSRNLNNLKVDNSACLELAMTCPPQADEFYVAASGMKTGRDLFLAAQAGFGAVLIGTFLMSSANPAESLAKLEKEFLSLRATESLANSPAR